MGTMFLAATTTKSHSSNFLPLLIIIVLFGLFYVTIIRPQRNKQRQAAQTQGHAEPGQRVRTTAGIYGTLVSGDDRDVIVEIAPGVEIQMLRRAIMEVVPDDDEGGLTTEAQDETEYEPESEYEPETGDEPASEDHEDLTT